MQDVLGRHLERFGQRNELVVTWSDDPGAERSAGSTLYGRGMGGEQEQDTETAPSGLVGRSIDEFVHQLRGFTDRARSLAGAVPTKLSLPVAAQPAGCDVRRAVAGRRADGQRTAQSIAAMQAQLEAFDQQMAVFERILDPLVDWSATWARLEEAVGDFVRPNGPTEKNGRRARRRCPRRRRPRGRRPWAGGAGCRSPSPSGSGPAGARG